MNLYRLLFFRTSSYLIPGHHEAENRTKLNEKNNYNDEDQKENETAADCDDD